MKKNVLMSLAAFVVLSASAMVMQLTYEKVSDDCNKCVISNQGITRKCGKCNGFLNSGKSEDAGSGWLKATFTCKKCGHSSVWKFKER